MLRPLLSKGKKVNVINVQVKDYILPFTEFPDIYFVPPGVNDYILLKIFENRLCNNVYL